MSLITLTQRHWHDAITSEQQAQAIDALEQGQVLFFPSLYQALNPEEHVLLDASWLAPKAKNMSLKPGGQYMDGVAGPTNIQAALLALCQHYAANTKRLIHTLLPHYRQHLIEGRTSYRPAAVSQRKQSPRKDDRRLHVDAFPSSPNQGKRILRVFCNINPQGEPRIWRLGEPFIQVAKRFLPSIKKPLPGSASLLHKLGITKTKRSVYDHYMLNIHDNMKQDDGYQRSVAYQEIAFPALSTWVVLTDQVSHAAMSGQFMLEQTFYLPVSAMKRPEYAPINIMAQLKQPVVAVQS